MDLDVQPKPRDDLIFRQLDEEWVLYDAEGRQLHVLNRTAAVVWLQCDGELTVREIADGVRSAFGGDVPREQVEADVLQAVGEFADRGLLA